MLFAVPSSGGVNTMIRITGIGDHDRPEWLIRINGIRRLSADCWTVIRHAAASGAIFVVPNGVQAAAAFGRLIPTSGFALVAAPDLQSTIRATVYLPAIASLTDNDLLAASTAKKQPAGRTRCAVGCAYVILQ